MSTPGLAVNETPPTPKIEITPAMLEAGVNVLWDYDPETQPKNEVVLAILRASLGDYVLQISE